MSSGAEYVLVSIDRRLLELAQRIGMLRQYPGQRRRSCFLILFPSRPNGQYSASACVTNRGWSMWLLTVLGMRRFRIGHSGHGHIEHRWHLPNRRCALTSFGHVRRSAHRRPDRRPLAHFLDKVRSGRHRPRFGEHFSLLSCGRLGQVLHR
jgi:hypothetical protein